MSEVTQADWDAAIDSLEAATTKLHSALSRQCNNIAVLLNHASIPSQWYERFKAELEQDRTLLNKEPAR